MSDDPDRDLLAGEYVLGTLDPAERDAAAALAAQDPRFARAVAAWEQRLAPLAVLAAPAPPPGALWDRIEASVAPADASTTDASTTDASPAPATPTVTGHAPALAPRPIAPRPIAPRPIAPRPIAPRPIAPRPIAPDPIAPDRVAPGPVAPGPVAPGPIAADRVASDLGRNGPTRLTPARPTDAGRSHADRSDAQPIRTTPRPTRRSLRFWQGATGAALALAAALAGVIVLRHPLPTSLAVLAPRNGGPALLALAAGPNGVMIRPAGVLAPVPAGREMELWNLPRGAHRPRPMGALPPDGRRLRMTLAPGTEIMVSLEPAGGSPTGLPTGPVLFAGRLEPM